MFEEKKERKNNDDGTTTRKERQNPLISRVTPTSRRSNANPTTMRWKMHSDDITAKQSCNPFTIYSY
jgi:hypothetical protein